MKGMNRAKNRGLYESTQLSENCIFISHKYEDLAAAKEIASYITDSGIDIYLDDKDSGLLAAVKANDSKKIVDCIENALASSTHILVLVTENTRNSWWVPYEVGYAKNGGTQIASLLLKNVNEFPDYLKIEKTLTGYESFSSYIRDIRHSHLMFESVSVQHKEQLLRYIREH